MDKSISVLWGYIKEMTWRRCATVSVKGTFTYCDCQKRHGQKGHARTDRNKTKGPAGAYRFKFCKRLSPRDSVGACFIKADGLPLGLLLELGNDSGVLEGDIDKIYFGLCLE